MLGPWEPIAWSVTGAARDAGYEEAAQVHSKDAAERSRAAMLIARRLGHRRNEATAMANLAEELIFSGQADAALELMDSWETDTRRDSMYTIQSVDGARGDAQDRLVGRVRLVPGSGGYPSGERLTTCTGGRPCCRR